jgi:hypothetical protein
MDIDDILSNTYVEESDEDIENKLIRLGIIKEKEVKRPDLSDIEWIMY